MDLPPGPLPQGKGNLEGVVRWASPPAPLHQVERGGSTDAGRFSAAGRGRGGYAGSPCARWSKAAGGAVLGWQDALGDK